MQTPWSGPTLILWLSSRRPQAAVFYADSHLLRWTGPEEVIVLGSFTLLAQSSGSGSGSSGLTLLLPLLLMGVIFYFLLIRPQRRQRQAHAQLVEGLDVGDVRQQGTGRPRLRRRDRARSGSIQRFD